MAACLSGRFGVAGRPVEKGCSLFYRSILIVCNDEKSSFEESPFKTHLYGRDNTGGKNVTFVGMRADKLKIKGATVNKESVKTNVGYCFKKCVSMFFISSFLMSCSTMQHIKRNQTLTQKQVNYYHQKNGNVFYLSSTYATFSVVWTYYTDRIEIYILQKGKVIQKQVFPEKEWIKYAEVALEDIEEELYQRCPLELDGDNFGFRIVIDGKTYNEDYGVDVNCLKTGKYKSNFLNKITNDIKTYKMWEIKELF